VAVFLVLFGLVSAGLTNAFTVLAADPAAADAACGSGAHTLSKLGDRVYPEMGNGGYSSVHTDVHIVYDAATNLFLPGNHVDLTQQATQCLTDFSLDFERTSANVTSGPNMTVDAVAVNGQPATFAFVQPTYPGDPNGQDDPDPLAHAVSNVNPVSATNPNPPACSPQVSGTSQNGQPCPANKLVITPSSPISSGSTFIVSIDYTGRPGEYNDGDGTTEGWFRSNNPVVDGAFVTTEPVGSMAWMPLNNHPSSKPTVDVYDTVNAGKTAISAGELVSTQANPPDSNFPGGSVTWHWHSPERIASYLLTNSIGSFDLTQQTVDGIKYYWAVPSSISATRKAQDKVVTDQQPGITQFQAQFNGPFPFTSNGVVIGLPSASFAEEMQTKITFPNGANSTPSVGTLAHENMHQWFGDNVTEAAFNLTFWKEGWATVGEYLNTARNAANAAGGLGTPAGNAAFDTSLINRFNTNYGATSNSAWTSAPSNPTVGNLFTTVSTYTRPGTAYLALRQILDASAGRPASDRWIGAMKQIQTQYGGGTITEAQLEAVFHQWLPNQSAACSTKLDTFFTQWFDTAYPTPNNPTNKPQITGPGIGGTSDHFYDDATACTRADQAISFGALPDKLFDDPDFAVSASSDSGLPVSFAASGQCTVSGTTVHILGLGSCTITASQAGDGVFKPAASVARTFAITKHPQTITFDPIGPRAYLDADFPIAPTASSGLPVSLSASGDCTVDSAVAPANVHIVQAGSCTITASQAGDGTYDPAPNVDNAFTIVEAQIGALSPVHAWVSLRNGDDVGTKFDVSVELQKNGTTIESGLLRCVIGIGRNPTPGTEVVVPWTLVPQTVNKGDILSLKLSTRIGTINETTKCAGHNSAVGLRLYYDSTAQASRFDATIGSVNFTEYLRSDGNVCKNAESTGVTSRTLGAAPTATAAKCKDSTTVNFSGGNPYKVISTWGSWTLP
jgi:hypothetical protein